MRILSSRSIQERAVEELGLDASALGLSSVEAIAASLRRAASFTTPCSASHIVTTVLDLLSVVPGTAVSREEIKDSLEALISYGDLFESEDVTGKSSSHLIYLTPPSFVELPSNLLLLVGMGTDGQYPLPEQIVRQVEPVSHYRRLSVADATDVAQELVRAGFLRIDVNDWLKAPIALKAAEHVSRYEPLLTPSGPVGELEGITVVESTRPVNYYRGRWSPLKSQSGKYVGRRPQAYGADFWCYFALDKGTVQWFVDFPRLEKHWRGCDEAWHLQQAIDSIEGHPQVYRVRPGTRRETVVLDFFSPVPRWASRRWDFVGMPTTAANCLFSYVFQANQSANEMAFAEERMWLRQL